MRNWDYRYCWLRDATFTLLALMHAGYYDEARTWRDWLFRAVAGSPDQLQIMYGLGGERRLTEWEVPWLPGFEGSRPVRIGNAAVNQTQLDVYGEILDALYHAQSHGLPPNQTRGRDRACRARTLGQDLGSARRRHLGGARAAAALHALQGDGVGCIRPGGQDPRAARQLRQALSSAGGRCATGSTKMSAARRSILTSAALSRLTGRRRSTRASCCCRWSAFCRRPTRASSAR